MICFEQFKGFIDKIVKSNEKIERISELLGGVEALYETSCMDEAIRMLEILCDDDSEMISYWAWELDFGRKWKPGCVTDSDGTDIKLETAEDLYHYLARDLAPGDTGQNIDGTPRTVFGVASSWPGLLDFELTYYPATDDYGMRIETIYQFDTDDGAFAYLSGIQQQFTDWMKANGHDTHRHISLFRMFEMCDSMPHYKSIDEAYAMFNALVCGACCQGVEGETYDKQ